MVVGVESEGSGSGSGVKVGVGVGVGAGVETPFENGENRLRKRENMVELSLDNCNDNLINFSHRNIELSHPVTLDGCVDAEARSSWILNCLTASMFLARRSVRNC